VGDASFEAGLAIGLLLGGVVFIVVDDTVLATKVEMRPPEPPRKPTPAATVKPRLALSAGDVQLRLTGQF